MNKKFSLFAAACVLAFSQVMAEDPRITQGRIFESQGNFEMALGEYRAMLAEDSKNSEAYMAAANVRVKMKDYSGALANFRLAYKFNPKMSAAYEGAAQVYELLGDKKRAAAERAKDPKNQPEEAAPAQEVATVAPKAEPAQVAEPVKAAEPAAAPAPKAEPAQVAEPVKAAEPAAAPAPKAEPAQVAEPVKAAEPAAAPTPKAEPAKVAEPVKATEPAVPAETLPKDPFERGKVLFAEGKYSEAAPLWREVLKKTPGHAGAYFYAGLTRFELGEYDKAEFNLKKGLEYKEEGNDANYFLACVYQKSNKTDLEKKFLNNYLKKAAPNGKYRRKAENRLAELNAQAEAAKAEEAAKIAEAKAAEPKAEPVEAPKAEPAKPVQNAAAVAAATPAAAETVVDAPEVKELSIASAVALFRAGNLEEALQAYKSLLETQQNPEERYFTLLQMGNIYREMRDFHSAVTRYREVVQQFPDSDWATEAERALEDAVWLEKHSSELPRSR